jgi:hypothetical protein
MELGLQMGGIVNEHSTSVEMLSPSAICYSQATLEYPPAFGSMSVSTLMHVKATAILQSYIYRYGADEFLMPL